MDKPIVVFGLFSVTVLTGAVAMSACSSTTTTVVTDDDGGPREGGTKEGGGGGGGEGGGGGGDPDEACGEEPTKLACGQCCATNHQTGYKVFETSLLECACDGTGAVDAGAGGPCATACATTVCATPAKQADTACDTCIAGTIGSAMAPCLAHVVSACQNEPDCLAQQQCVSQCQSKP